MAINKKAERVVILDSTNEIMITYEGLFEFLMKEKGREELQKIEPDFYKTLSNYILEKSSFYQEDSPEEREKKRRHIQNIVRMAKGFYEKREEKILNMALIKSRTNSNLIDTLNAIEEERQFFNEIAEVLNRFRNGILNNVINAKMPEIRAMEKEPAEPEKIQKAEKTGKKLVRIVFPIPKFFGRELEIYGPFERDDVVILPEDIADILIIKRGAEEIEGLE